jgi:MFS family permease
MSTGTETLAAAPARVGNVRWIVVGLLFTAMVINYVDRQMLGFLKPTLSKELGWSETNYADIVFFFQAAYAVSYLAFGKIVDRRQGRLHRRVPDLDGRPHRLRRGAHGRPVHRCARYSRRRRSRRISWRAEGDRGMVS